MFVALEDVPFPALLWVLENLVPVFGFSALEEIFEINGFLSVATAPHAPAVISRAVSISFPLSFFRVN